MAIGFGIIGCGMISRFHARAIADIKGARVVACQSSNFSSAQKFAAEFSATAYPTLDQLLADPAIEVVTICTPSGAHLEPAVAAAKAGKHVVVEKPLEINLQRCDRIIAACEKNKVLLSTILPARFLDSSILLKSAVENKKFGTPTLGGAYVKWFRTQQYYDSGDWRGTWKLDGGGALMNQAIHCVDLLTWIMGPVSQVTAKTATLAHERIEVEDVAIALLQFENGALGVVEATTAAFPGWLKRIEIHGSQGSARIEEDDIKCWQFASMSAKDKRVASQYNNAVPTGGGAGDPAAIGHAGHTRQLKDVLKAIRKGSNPAIDGREGRRSVEIIQAIYKSAGTGKTIQLPIT